MPQISDDTQDQVIGVIKEVADAVNKLDLIFQALSSQDKMLAGGVVFGMYNPWTETETSHFVGNQVMVPVVINKMVETFRRGPVPKEDSPKIKIDPSFQN